MSLHFRVFYAVFTSPVYAKEFYFNPLKHELRLNNIKKLSPYFKENTNRLHYKDQLLNAIWGNNRCFYENHTKPKSTICGQNAEI
jgi:hypothetical protein